MSPLRRLWILYGLLFLYIVQPIEAYSRLKVVVTFSVLKDLVANIAGETVDIVMLVGPNSDAHVFEPTPETAKSLVDADIIFMNGLGFEGWITRLLSSTKTKAKVVVVSDGIKPRLFKKANSKEISFSFDPHAWHDVKNVLIYSDNIEKALTVLIPDARDKIKDNAKRYRAKLNELEAWIHRELESIPLPKRKVVTAHDAFGYFGEAYKVEFLSVQGLSTESEPSAKEIANLIKGIKEKGIKEVFVENITNERLIRHIAEETGAQVGGTLYSDALSRPNEPAATYISMIQTNVQQLKHGMLKNK